MTDSAPPAGWYDDYATPGGRRWWDGAQWTSDVQPPPAAPTPPTRPQRTSVLEGQSISSAHTPHTLVWDRPEPDASAGPIAHRIPAVHAPDPLPYDEEPRAWWRKKRVLIPAGLVLLGAVASVTGGDEPAETGPATVAAGEEAETDDETDDEVDRFAGALGEVDPAAPEATSTTQATVPTSATTSPAATPTTEQPVEVASASPETTAAPVTTAPPPTTAAPTTAATPPPTTPAPATTAAPTTAAPAQPDCHPAYSPCIPNFPGDALNCGDLAAGQKPVTVPNVGNDPYGLDSDNDGVGCESG